MTDQPCAARFRRAIDLELHFESAARVIVKRPYKVIGLSLLVTLILAAGFSKQFTEGRPEKQFVPSDAPSLKNKDYVEAMWPGEISFSAWIAMPAVKGANMLEAGVMQELKTINDRIKAIKVDGKAAALKVFPKLPTADIATVDYKWSFAEEAGDVRRKCYQFGPTCGETSILNAYNLDGRVIDKLTDSRVLNALNFWEKQDLACPVSVARSDSPCVDASAWVAGAAADDCQTYGSSAQKDNCLLAEKRFCDSACPSEDASSCEDSGCKRVYALYAAQYNTSHYGGYNVPFKPFKVKTVASSGNGPAKTDGKYARADVIRGAYILSSKLLTYKGTSTDVVAQAWEKETLCELGIPVAGYKLKDCPLPTTVRFTALFGRSFDDEFGGAIGTDLARFAAAIVAIIIYMVVMISPCDPVHSMIGFSFVAVAITMLSYVCCTGLGSFAGIFTSNLSNLVPFLLLALGVDDAFVLIGEYNKVTADSPEMHSDERCVQAMKYAGVSVLITSLTDALAFLIASSFPLPALTSFCLYAGIGISFCFVFQLTVLLPFLVIDSRRAEAKRYDLLCCWKSQKPHEFADPRGGCCIAACTGVKFPKNTLERLLTAMGRLITTLPGKIFVLAGFATIFALGIVGAVRQYPEFKVEWFIPADSYVQKFFTLNDAYFAQGTPFAVYTVHGDYYEQQAGMLKLSTYVNTTKYIDHDEDISDWSLAFRTYAKDSGLSGVDADGLLTDRGSFYTELKSWLYSSYSAGGAYRKSIKWEDDACNDESTQASCDQGKGIRGTRISATTALKYTDTGTHRFQALSSMRKDLAAALPGSFPYSYAFLYWEENGSITQALVNNLIICGIVIVCVVFALITDKKAALIVIANLIAAVVEVVGYLYWWGVTISGVSTIFILISFGLIVDYSSHIAHVFTLSTGTPEEKAISTLSRIGPAVFNAIFSTLFAVLALCTSKSFVFFTFFQALCLTVLIGGSHGLILLPVLLTLFDRVPGCKKLPSEGTTAAVQSETIKTEQAMAAVPGSKAKVHA